MHYIDTLYTKLKQLEATPGKNDKLAIVKSFTDNELQVVTLALDPAINFYMAKLPTIPFGAGEWSDATDNLLHDLYHRDITGHAAAAAVEGALSTLKPEHHEVLRRVILKNLKAGVGVTMINTAFPGVIFEQPYMRCSLPEKSNLHKWGPEVWEAGVISDVKADGMFAARTQVGGRVPLTSRQGNTFPPDALPHLHEAYPETEGKQTHGELLVYQDGVMLERQIGNGILNSLLQGGNLEPGQTVRYVVWDVIPAGLAVAGGSCETELRFRRAQLQEICASVPVLTLIESRTVHSPAEARAHCAAVMAAGGEGTVDKNPLGIWKDTTSKDCVKQKLTVDLDLEFESFVPGDPDSKHASTFGSARMSSSDRLLRVDVSGFTDAMRLSLWERRETLPGKVFTVRANQLLSPSPSNDLHSLFLPRVIEERLDKQVADTLDEIKAQFAAAVAA